MSTASSTSSAHEQQQQPKRSLQDIYDELALKFFLNLPDSELLSWERVFIQLQQAWWYYYDTLCERYTYLPKIKERQFIEQFFRHSDVLQSQVKEVPQLYAQFKTYLGNIPVAGVILLNSDRSHVLMVKSYGKHGSWGFVRGKLDENETEVQCAVREAKEEAGFDCSHLINSQQYIQAVSNGKQVTLFLVDNTPTDYAFHCTTRYEVGEIGWIPIGALPSKKSPQGSAEYTFGNVLIFAIKLREWLKQQQRPDQKQRQQQQQHHNTQAQRSHSVGTHSRAIEHSQQSAERASYDSVQVENQKPSPHQQQQSANPQRKSKRGNQQQQQHPVNIAETDSSTQFATPAPRQQQPRAQQQQPHSANKHSNNRNRRGQQHPAGYKSDDALTFGDDATSGGWNAEAMFKLNEERFGLKSTVPDDEIKHETSSSEVQHSHHNGKHRANTRSTEQHLNTVSSVPASPAHTKQANKNKQKLPPHSSGKPSKPRSQHQQRTDRRSHGGQFAAFAGSSGDDELDFAHDHARVVASYAQLQAGSSNHTTLPPVEKSLETQPQPQLPTSDKQQAEPAAPASDSISISSAFSMSGLLSKITSGLSLG
ncbi:hypothetical protein RGQ29_032240 [Quercus rubra]|uniref:Nudix hydrolase domain-containing protein n=1 Tax=Quercus rubra TaxID=3512 RepID=A0AAN7DU44_QUERU|nr:hypothetical protein RGQ29_032240 [Quercus rubra]